MLKIGDKVKIRGDMRKNQKGQCVYFPDQLVDGKYLKHTGTGKLWVGEITKINGDMVQLNGGGYMGIEILEREQDASI